MIKWLVKTFIPSEKIVDMFTVSVQSSRSIEDVISKLEPACSKYKFALLHSYVYHEVVASKGFPIERKVYVYEVCQAKVASMMLTSHPYFAAFMPCRIAVYEANAKTVVSMMNMEMILESLKAEKALYEEAKGLFKTLQTLMNEIGK